MAQLDFPNSPVIGDEYTPPGGQTYKWNGTAWVTAGTNQFVAKTGDTMTGPLTTPKLLLDPQFSLEVAGGLNPVINFDINDYLAYDRTGNAIGVVIGGQVVFTFDALKAVFNGTGALKVPTGITGERPGTPATGYFRFNTTTGKFEGYNGSTWGAIGGGGASVGPTAPSAPAGGDLWWNSELGTLFVYYVDANTSQWVAASYGGAVAGTTALEDRIAALEAAAEFPVVTIQTAANTAFALPAGGEWFWWAARVNNNGELNGSAMSGVDPGGTPVLPPVAGRHWVGFARRIG